MNQGSVQHCFALQSEAFISSSGFLVRKCISVSPEFVEVIGHYFKMMAVNSQPQLLQLCRECICRAPMSLWIHWLKPHALHTQPACKQGQVSFHCWGSDLLWLTCWTICTTLNPSTLFPPLTICRQKSRTQQEKNESNMVALVWLYATIQISNEVWNSQLNSVMILQIWITINIARQWRTRPWASWKPRHAAKRNIAKVQYGEVCGTAVSKSLYTWSFKCIV